MLAKVPEGSIGYLRCRVFSCDKKAQNNLSCCPINWSLGGSKQKAWRMIWFG